MSKLSLTSKEKELCKLIVVRGAEDPHDVLKEQGWDKHKRLEWLGKKAVQDEINRFTKLYNERTQIQERNIFFSQLEVNRMVPAALNVLATTLRGYGTDENNQRVDPPSNDQFKAAMEVLNRSSIGGKEDWSEGLAQPMVDARSVNVNIGEGADLDEVSSRERIRSVLDVIVSRVEKAAKVRGSTNGKQVGLIKAGRLRRHTPDDTPAS